MTKGAALAKACRIWGPKAHVRKGACYLWTRRDGSICDVTCSAFKRHQQPCPTGVPVYSVGHLESAVGITMFCVNGEGATWEDAFAEHEARERKDHEEYEARKATNAQTARDLNKKMSAAFFGTRAGK